MKQDESVHGLWRRAIKSQDVLFVDRSSRRIPWYGDGEVRKEDQGSLLAQGASSDIDAGELKHALVN
jgi:hypothetical protein